MAGAMPGSLESIMRMVAADTGISIDTLRTSTSTTKTRVVEKAKTVEKAKSPKKKQETKYGETKSICEKSKAKKDMKKSETKEEEKKLKTGEEEKSTLQKPICPGCNERQDMAFSCGLCRKKFCHGCIEYVGNDFKHCCYPCSKELLRTPTCGGVDEKGNRCTVYLNPSSSYLDAIEGKTSDGSGSVYLPPPRWPRSIKNLNLPRRAGYCGPIDGCGVELCSAHYILTRRADLTFNVCPRCIGRIRQPKLVKCNYCPYVKETYRDYSPENVHYDCLEKKKQMEQKLSVRD